MRREPSLTFEGALRILGQHEHKTIDRIDKLLGGVILGGGAVAGAVALGVTPLAPLAAFGVVWGWVEQKGLAVELLKSAVDAVSGKVAGLRGLEKRELIAAAHSTIVVAALFEAFRDHVGKQFSAELKITDEEKVSVINQMGLERKQGFIGILYTAEIPAPSATTGFEENAENVADWQNRYIVYLNIFLRGLAVGQDARIDWVSILNSAAERYRSRYLELAAKVPEFAIWAQLGEHAATRAAIDELGDEVERGTAGLTTDIAELSTAVEGVNAVVRESNADVVAALNANRDALNRVAALLSVGAGSPHLSLSGLRAVVSFANAGILREPIVPADPERYPTGLTIPRVSEIYVNPRYRVARLNENAHPASEQWWDERESRDDFDVLLTAHVTSPDATRVPMLLLGHPGAGKSLLTKVFAARLPDSQYTVVRVPLRRVSADASIHRQIEEALEASTDQRIAWSDLAAQSADAGTVRVVLLDGLDELLQASEHDRSRYLEDVMDFQEREAVQRRPVVMVVTSRTVVADRVRIPEGTTIVKLDPFNDDDIADWLGRWKRINADPIAARAMGELTIGAVRRQPELAEQPLLLLMLALYAADRELPPLDADIATAELYRRLLDGFARREAGKDVGLGHDPSPDELEQRVRDHLDRLAVAALGMFNRGRQDISEEELGKDLEALEPRLMDRFRRVEAGRRIIGQFFFVHAPEARTIAGQQSRNGLPQRAYEFLHATFGEYLVARRVMDELIEVAEKAFVGRRGASKPDDDLLHALLSAQLLAVRQSTLGFAYEIFSESPFDERGRLLEVLEMLIATFRNRHDSNQYASYRPVPPDQVRALAYYSANLVTLRILLGSLAGGLPLPDLLHAPGDATELWRSTVKLWEAGLGPDGLEAMLDTIGRTGDSIFSLYLSGESSLRSPEGREIALANLIGDPDLERSLRFGVAITTDFIYYDSGSAWADMMSSWLIPAIAGMEPSASADFTVPPPDGTPPADLAKIAHLIIRFLRSGECDPALADQLLQLLSLLRPQANINELMLAKLALANPELRDRFTMLSNLSNYGSYAELVRRAKMPIAPEEIDFEALSDDAIVAIQSILAGGEMFSDDEGFDDLYALRAAVRWQERARGAVPGDG
jgi:hypothetical protein